MSHSVTPGAEVGEVKACSVLTALGPGLSLTGHGSTLEFLESVCSGEDPAGSASPVSGCAGLGDSRGRAGSGYPLGCGTDFCRASSGFLLPAAR